MHISLTWFRSGVGLAVLFLVLTGAVTAVVLLVPSEVGRAVGGSVLAVGLLALAWRALVEARRGRTRG